MQALGLLLIFAVGMGQLVLGFMGLDHMIGLWAGLVGLALAAWARIMLPMTIGSYFGAVEVMGWPWWVGVLVVAPGLLFIVPSLVSGLIEKISHSTSRG